MIKQPGPVKRERRTNAELADLDAAIITAVEADAPVTLRGVYYRVVSAGAVDKTENGYKAIGRRLLALRRSGAVAYWKITDGTRFVLGQDVFDDAGEALRDTALLYRRNLWRDQNVSLNLFTEKDAISGVVAPVARQWCVPLGVMRGYCSESFAWSMAQEIKADPKVTYVYQLGDHDPSGVGAWRDLQRKIAAFAPHSEVHFERIAVTEEQIEEMNLPTRPTKASDSRAKNFTGESVEVDAIPAPILRELVTEAIEQHVNAAALAITQQVEASERDLLQQMAEGWAV